MSVPPPRSSRAVLALITALLFATGPVRAHEEYVVDDASDVSVWEFLAAVLSDPLSLALLLGGTVAVLLAAGTYLAVRPGQADVTAFRLAMREYSEYVPWLLRISMGIPLIGAGFGGYFVSPAVEQELRLLQVTLGFLLLFGLATRVVAVTTLAVYLGGLVQYPQLLLQFEVVGGTLAIALVGSGKPSADHVLYRISEASNTLYGRFDVIHGPARSQQRRLQPYEALVPFVTRVGLGLAFFMLGFFEKFLNPGLGLAVVERYDLTAVVPVQPELWVLGAALAEMGLGILLILGLFTRASALTAILMFTLTLFALPDDPVLAHVGLYGLASALVITGSGPYALDRTVPTLLEDAKRRYSGDVADSRL